jgi:hypothetical protein
MVFWQTKRRRQVLLESTAIESESLVPFIVLLYANATKESSCLGLQL